MLYCAPSEAVRQLFPASIINGFGTIESNDEESEYSLPGYDCEEAVERVNIETHRSNLGLAPRSDQRSERKRGRKPTKKLAWEDCELNPYLSDVEDMDLWER